MSIYNYEEAFGAWDMTTRPMRQAIARWQRLYYGDGADQDRDSCQKIAYTVVDKLVKAMFGEYASGCTDPVGAKILEGLDRIRRPVMEQLLIGGECYIKPCLGYDGFVFRPVGRGSVLIFGRDGRGEPTDLGMVETTLRDKYYYTLLERRSLDRQGHLILENRLYRSLSKEKLGGRVSLRELPEYEGLQERYRFPVPLGGIGMVRLRTPMLNCVDGSDEGTAVYGAAADLIDNIDRNEAQMNGEFSRGESRIITSADLLGRDGLTDHLFVGLDEDPEQVGLTIFSPQLREQSFLARKQEYLRNVESLIGLRRGMLCDAGEDKRTATEIASSAGDFNLTVIQFQNIWQKAAEETMTLCAALSQLYRLPVPETTDISMDWGNGTLYDEDRTWQDYRQMVSDGLLKPEIALGWRFGMPARTEADLAAIRSRLMPDTISE